MLDLKRTFLQSYLHFRHQFFSNQQATPGKCFPLHSINDENFIFNINEYKKSVVSLIYSEQNKNLEEQATLETS